MQISRFTEIILEQDNDEEYKYFRVEEDPARPTLLHLAAERNFLHVAKLLTETYPSLLYLETEEVSGERAYLPVEKALLSYQDETAAYLIKISYANLCKFSNLLACVLLTTSQPFLGLMLSPNVSATDILRGNEAKTRMFTLLVVADYRNCSIARY